LCTLPKGVVFRCPFAGIKDYTGKEFVLRGGQNKKSVEQHLADGTYRADRHGLRASDDSEILQKMKHALFQKFKKVDKFLNEADVGAVTKDNVNYYLSVIRAFDIITRNPTSGKKDGGPKDGKMEL
jgi:hypothetical protein